MLDDKTVSRFQSKIRKTPTCWLWTSGKFSNGYGMFYANQKSRTHKAHRISYEIFNGKIPNGNLVMHECDNRLCVNPSHLKCGTQLDNIHDMFKKHRQNKANGERIANAKLTAHKVKSIRKMFFVHKLSSSKIGKRFGISQTCANKVIRRFSWKHVND